MGAVVSGAVAGSQWWLQDWGRGGAGGGAALPLEPAQPSCNYLQNVSWARGC